MIVSVHRRSIYDKRNLYFYLRVRAVQIVIPTYGIVTIPGVDKVR